MVNKQRIWEIDFLRGIAIILMIAFHIIYDLAEFYGYDFDYLNGFWFFVGRSCAILFIVISGISTNLSSNILKLSLKVYAAALTVTAVTYFFDTNLYVRFGILHLLASCIFISILVHKLKKPKAVITAALLFGTAAFGLGFLISQKTFGSIIINPSFNHSFLNLALLPLGIPWRGFGSFDYYPLFPWSGFFFYGLALGKFLYKEKLSLFKENPKGIPGFFESIFGFLGRRSLFIYLVHQPVIIALLFLYYFQFKI